MKLLPGLVTAVLLPNLIASADAQMSGVVEIEVRVEGAVAYFDPIGIWVEPGTTIRFIHAGGAQEILVHDPDEAPDLIRIPRGAAPWDTRLLCGDPAPTAPFEVTVTVEGVYDYSCSAHQAAVMAGRIVVAHTAGDPPAPADEPPLEGARGVLPSVEQILAEEIVPWSWEAVRDMELGSWSGSDGYTTEFFGTAGAFEITLAAWCFEGVGYVSVVAFDRDDVEVGEITVLGEGVASVVVDVPSGAYRLEVTVSHFHTYIWELRVTPAAGQQGDPEVLKPSAPAAAAT